MSSAASTATLRKLMDERLARLSNELESICEAEISDRVKQETDAVFRRLADDLNQAVRRLRQAEGLEEISATLADASAGYCNVAAVFSVNENAVRGVRVRGPGYEDAVERLRGLEFPMSQAGAFAGVLETREPVITVSTPGQLSVPLMQFFAHPPDDRVYLFPVSVEQKPQAVLYAVGAVQMAPLELLAQAASSALEARARRTGPAQPVDLVSIQPAVPPARHARPSWDELLPERQQRHIRAQRFARVHVAEMRLYHSDAVKSGRQRSDIYGELRQVIDRARAAYRESFVEGDPTMVDYLHLELLLTLGHDDETLLGKDYPGPLV